MAKPMRKILVPKWRGTVKKSEIIAAIRRVKAESGAKAVCKKTTFKVRPIYKRETTKK